MKFYKLYLIFFLTSTLLAKPNWISDLEKAKELAQKEKKPIFVDFYSKTCHYCKVIEKEIYHSKEFQKFLNRFVFVLIDGDKHPEIPDRFHVHGYPTVIIFDSNLYELGRIEGYFSKPIYIDRVNSILKRATYHEELIANTQKESKNYYYYFQLGSYYFQINDLEKSEEYILKAHQVLSPNDQNYYQNRKNLLYNLAVIQTKKRDYKKAYSYWNAYLAWLKRDDPDFPLGMYYKTISFLYKNYTQRQDHKELFYSLKPDEQKKFLEELKRTIKILPESPEKEQAKKILFEIES
ncbi:MAG: thioredoxin family protein [Leptospiraceae bacterium]|nr:thioredoxin family protein [Leptospiraceae bacterium]MDW7975318.1 thioredoxin family protein [Leptospiraceae bacterium]